MIETIAGNSTRIEIFGEDSTHDAIQERKVQARSVQVGSRNSTEESFCNAFAPDGCLLAWSTGQGFIDVIRLPPLQTVHDGFDFIGRLPIHKIHRNTIDCSKEVVSMKFCPVPMTVDNETSSFLLATGLVCGIIKIWNPLPGDLLYNLSDHLADVTGLCFLNFEELLLISSSQDKTLKVWDLNDNGNMTLTMNGHVLPVLDCSSSPSAPLICSVGRGRMAMLWKLEHKRKISFCIPLRGHLNDVTSCCWSPDGAMLATASNDTTVIIWNPHSINQILVLWHINPPPQPIFAGGSNGYWVKCVRFSPDGSRIATLCEDNKLRVWELWSSSMSRSKKVSKTGNICNFSPDGSVVAISHCNGSLTLMDIGVSVMSLKHLSRLAIRRSFTPTFLEQLKLPPLLHRFLHYNY